MKQIISASALALALAACSPEPSATPEPSPDAANTAAPSAEAPATPEANTAAPTTPPAAPANVLTLEGLGPLKIGQPVPADSGWTERGAQISEECRTVSSPDVPGVYAIVEGGRVRRVTAGQNSTVKLIEGIGVGATEAKVRAAFPGFREEAHKYSDVPAKYLTAPNAPSGDPALRFEIGQDGKVSLVHIGTMPVLAYVEGCA